MLSVSEPLVMFLFLMRISWCLISLSQHFTCSLIYLPSTSPPLDQQTVFRPDSRAACVCGICLIFLRSCVWAWELVVRDNGTYSFRSPGCSSARLEGSDAGPSCRLQWWWSYRGRVGWENTGFIIREPERGRQDLPGSFYSTFTEQCNTHIKAGNQRANMKL